MDNGYLLTVAVFLIVLLLAVCVVCFLLYRKSRLNEHILSEQINATLESSNRKSEFFSNMTHELKTPLSVILGAVQLLEMKGSREDGNSSDKNLKIIKCNCYRLLRLTNNLLDLTRMEAGYLLLKPVNCDLDLLLEEIVQSVVPYARNKEINLHYDKAPEPITIAIDIEKAERIMLNLLSNAIKFTKPGGTVSVSCRLACERAMISVRDSGSGIPPESQDVIFNRYKQAGNAPSVENEGCGIGLSLVKSFVSLHKGDIKIISEKGKGTEFVINLPIKQMDVWSDEVPSDDLNSRINEAAKIEFSILHTIST